MVVVQKPPVLGVPEITPLELIDKPVGKPVADQLLMVPPVSVAAIASETVSPSLLFWSAGVGREMETGLVMVQWKVMSAVEVPSPAVTVTKNGPFWAAPGATVPVMEPVLVLILSPLGSPWAV